MTKNDTRIASVLGTWTGWTHLQTSILGQEYEIMAYAVLHLMPDPNREYSCSLAPECSEWNNRLCQADDGDGQGHVQTSCATINETVSDWSDVVAFVNIGSHATAGFPVNIHDLYVGTGGWVGPYNLVLAQDPTIPKNITTLQTNGESVVTTILDRYAIRYITTPSTPRLRRRPPNDTLHYSDDFFQLSLGPAAVEATQVVQSQLTHGEDPHAAQLGTCDHGNFRPILPIVEFQWRQKHSNVDPPYDTNHSAPEEEFVFAFDYQVMGFTPKHDSIYRFTQQVQKLINRRHFGFKFNGPYCYKDFTGGWAAAISINSTETDTAISVDHACVQGLPCLPPAAFHGNGVGPSPAVIPRDTTHNHAVAGLVQLALLTVMVVVLCVALVISISCNACQKRRHRRVLRNVVERMGNGARIAARRDTEVEIIFDEDDDGNDDGSSAELQVTLLPNEESSPDAGLREPLLSSTPTTTTATDATATEREEGNDTQEEDGQEVV